MSITNRSARRCLDALLFQFYAKNDGLRLTDLHQGIVWGTNTPQTIRDERLVNRFDYDSDYGTVLNRYVICFRGNLVYYAHTCF